MPVLSLNSCKRKGPNWPFSRFSGGHLWLQRGISAMARSGRNTVYYPEVFTTTHYKDLTKLLPPKAHKLSEKQLNQMRNWRAMYGQSIPEKTTRNMTTKDNRGTLSTNRNVADSVTIQPRFHRAEWNSSDPSAAWKKKNTNTNTNKKKKQRLCTNQARLSVFKLIPVILISRNTVKPVLGGHPRDPC